MDAYRLTFCTDCLNADNPNALPLGGAISLTGGTSVVIDSSSFTGNRASSVGGALHVSTYVLFH